MSARAQWVVYDPVNNDPINPQYGAASRAVRHDDQNQVQQIQSLTDQLNEFKHYESLFGDPRRSCSRRSNRSLPTCAKRNSARH
jgi:hypothetical protein